MDPHLYTTIENALIALASGHPYATESPHLIPAGWRARVIVDGSGVLTCHADDGDSGVSFVVRPLRMGFERLQRIMRLAPKVRAAMAAFAEAPESQRPIIRDVARAYWLVEYTDEWVQALRPAEEARGNSGRFA